MDPSIFSQLQAKKETLRRVVVVEEEKEKTKENTTALATSTKNAANDASNYDEEEESQRRKEFFQSGCSIWYDDLKNVTFSSTFCALTRTETEIIVQYYDEKEKIKGKNALAIQQQQALVAATMSKLENLKTRLAKILEMETAKSPVNRAFVKLNTRSPKDSPNALAAAKASYLKRLATETEAAGGMEPDANERWKMLSDEATKSLAVNTVEEALELLLDSPTRIREDLDFVLGMPTGGAVSSKAEEEATTYDENDGIMEAKDLSPEWPICLVARAWDPRVRPVTEFRGICWDGKLTCLSQYYHSFYFPEHADQKEQIQKDILECSQRPDVQAALAKLGGHCIMDFCWLGPGGDDVLIVELNPFDGKHFGTLRASTGLFVWDDPTDREIMKGNAPFEFRIRLEPEKTNILKHSTHPDWRDIIFPPKFQKVET